jgi:hypothetical protein
MILSAIVLTSNASFIQKFVSQIARWRNEPGRKPLEGVLACAIGPGAIQKSFKEFQPFQRLKSFQTF